MKITVSDDRVFPTLGIEAKAGDKITVPNDSVVETVIENPAEADDTKVGE